MEFFDCVWVICSLLVCFIFVSGCVPSKEGYVVFEKDSGKIQKVNKYEGEKIFFINSYHEGYGWSDGIERGIHSVLNNTGVELRIFRMDSVRNTDEGFIKQKAEEAKLIIKDFRPDVVITSDDAAFKYVIMPFFRDSALPVVFCGINWDASIYGAPYNNTAGMVEVALISKIVETTQQYSKGNRWGFLTGDVLSEHRNAQNWEGELKGGFAEVGYVKTFDEWKLKYAELQDKVDNLFIGSSAGITGWDGMEAEKFVLENTKIPSGTELEIMMPFSLVGLVKVAEEQGEWSAQTALEILDGKKPSDIPLVKNKKGNLIINFRIAEKLGIIFSPTIIKNAKIIIGRDE